MLYAKHTQTYEEFCFRTAEQQGYVEKLDKWIAKKRYTCRSVGGNPDLLEIKIKIFKFVLKKISRDDMDILRDEFKGLKEQDEQLKRELKLFNYQFLSNGEGNRRKLEYQLGAVLGDAYRAKIVDNIECLYDKYEGQGLVQEDPNMPGVHRNYLLLKDSIASEYFQGSLGSKYAAKHMEALVVAKALTGEEP